MGTTPSLPLPSLSILSSAAVPLPLEVGPLNPARVWGALKVPPAKSGAEHLVHFSFKLTCDGYNFNNFPDNQVIKWRVVYSTKANWDQVGGLYKLKTGGGEHSAPALLLTLTPAPHHTPH